MEHDPEQTIAYLTGKVDEYVKQAGRDTVMANVEKSPTVRYARIADGESCDFCRMLASRGFVYRTQSKAGGNAAHGSKADSYHPFCNCQIAVSHDVYIEKYDVAHRGGVTTVTRGYSLGGNVVSPGRDKSRKLREIDIDALYEEYKQVGREFSTPAKRKRDEKAASRNLMGGTKLPPDEFQAAMQSLADAQTLDELHAQGQAIVDDWPRNEYGRNAEQWDEMSRFAQARERELKEQRQVENLTPRQKLEREARDALPQQAAEMGITLAEARRRFDALVASNTDAQLRRFIKKYAR